jgi:hypothetical protein
VAVRDGQIGAVARLRLAPDSPVYVQALAADDIEGAEALLAGARAAFPGTTLLVSERDRSVVRAIVGDGATFSGPRQEIYARVPSLARLLEALVPVLDKRLSASPLATERGDLDISLYTSSVRLHYESGRIIDVAVGNAIHEPEVGAVGIPPDLVPRLVFGAGGALALEDHPDVYLGRFRPLMAALFPPQRVDLLTW